MTMHAIRPIFATAVALGLLLGGAGCASGAVRAPESELDRALARAMEAVASGGDAAAIDASLAEAAALCPDEVRPLACVGALAVQAAEATADPRRQDERLRLAEWAFARAHAIAPADPDRQRDLATTVLRRGDHARAADLLQRYVARQPRDAEALVALARAELLRGDAAEAGRRLAERAALGPLSPGELELAGAVHFLADEPEEALASYARAAEGYGGAPPARVHYQIGLIREEMGDLGGAMRSYEAAIATDPRYERARERIAVLRARAGAG